jgi:16S rRNA G966 N2-methylase RsmD
VFLAIELFLVEYANHACNRQSMFALCSFHGGLWVTNKLYYGDNLGVLREHIADASVDLVYLDPPFNSNATYNVLFKAPDGVQSQAQIEAFDDTWHWTESAENAYREVLHGPNTNAAEMLKPCADSWAKMT